MRRLLFALSAAALVAGAACGDTILAPVQTVDGQWSGVQNGYSLSFNLTQADTLVSGGVNIASVGGSFAGSASGTFKYPILHLKISVPNFNDADYDGTMSQSQAKIVGQLNGSGLTNVEVDVIKK
ncbi:MAG TPA: hypothetical protein VH277_09895 [Gemmatimonadaceae bacterium]|jgi:hypothetical protein|nr:hypothetical protein [Gemmatimonadaceae bacterium]